MLGELPRDLANVILNLLTTREQLRLMLICRPFQEALRTKHDWKVINIDTREDRLEFALQWLRDIDPQTYTTVHDVTLTINLAQVLEDANIDYGRARRLTFSQDGEATHLLCMIHIEHQYLWKCKNTSALAVDVAIASICVQSWQVTSKPISRQELASSFCIRNNMHVDYRSLISSESRDVWLYSDCCKTCKTHSCVTCVSTSRHAAVAYLGVFGRQTYVLKFFLVTCMLVFHIVYTRDGYCLAIKRGDCISIYSRESLFLLGSMHQTFSIADMLVQAANCYKGFKTLPN